jgi:hypothetical protein
MSRKITYDMLDDYRPSSHEQRIMLHILNGLGREVEVLQTDGMEQRRHSGLPADERGQAGGGQRNLHPAPNALPVRRHHGPLHRGNRAMRDPETRFFAA